MGAGASQPVRALTRGKGRVVVVVCDDLRWVRVRVRVSDP